MHLEREFESSSGNSGLGFDDGSPCKPEGPRLRGTLKTATVSPQAVACYAMSPVAQRHPLACSCPAAGPSDGYHVSHWVCKLQLICKSKAFPKPRSFGEILIWTGRWEWRFLQFQFQRCPAQLHIFFSFHRVWPQANNPSLSIQICLVLRVLVCLFEVDGPGL